MTSIRSGKSSKKERSPFMALLLRYNSLKEGREEKRERGTGPVRELKLRSNTWRPVNNDNSAGMVPDIIINISLLTM